MFIARAFITDNKMNDSQSFLVQESFLSRAAEDGGEMFVQLDEKGYLNKGQMHIKATLESDNQKSFLLQIHNND
jgi:exo-beta-1,3-glucanase (GH17 family)